MLKDQALEQVFSQFYEEEDADFLSLRDRYSGRTDDKLKQMLLRIYEFCTSRAERLGWLEGAAENFDEQGIDVYKRQLVHRLDRPAAGLMVFARTSKAAARLAEQVRTRQMQKKYLAVVAGDGLPEQGRMEDYLLKDVGKNISRRAQPHEKGAKRAVLEYRVLEARQGQALVLVHLETGRPHQIRCV